MKFQHLLGGALLVGAAAVSLHWLAPAQAASPASSGVSDQEVQRIVAALDRGRQAWIEGRSESGAAPDVMVQAADMVIFPPFGGELRRGGAPPPGADSGVAAGTQTLIEAQRQTAALFKGGTGRVELLQHYSAGDLLVLVLMERNDVRFDGYQTPQPWVLRTTQVFRRDGTRWVRLHRHADPLLKIRSLPETLALY
jgi:hypothetical protein